MRLGVAMSCGDDWIVIRRSLLEEATTYPLRPETTWISTAIADISSISAEGRKATEPEETDVLHIGSEDEI
jgi:hypothetical protein